ncbi:helix-turn-helix domain-containing protein [Arcobacter vandammei]|uniref:helix-turn-helix domain-containing protein n=1 Tax=Arcobacter vandammei TaxID=2782243 RepID=UPI0018E06359|nr:helix-turn-helix domain-containing protein [Arcobacter vandammei]
MKNIERPRFLRAKELADYLCIGESTVWYYLKIGKIKSIKISPKVTLFNVAEVEEALCS